MDLLLVIQVSDSLGLLFKVEKEDLTFLSTTPQTLWGQSQEQKEHLESNAAPEYFP